MTPIKELLSQVYGWLVAIATFILMVAYALVLVVLPAGIAFGLLPESVAAVLPRYIAGLAIVSVVLLAMLGGD